MDRERRDGLPAHRAVGLVLLLPSEKRAHEAEPARGRVPTRVEPHVRLVLEADAARLSEGDRPPRHRVCVAVRDVHDRLHRQDVALGVQLDVALVHAKLGTGVELHGVIRAAIVARPEPVDRRHLHGLVILSVLPRLAGDPHGPADIVADQGHQVLSLLLLGQRRGALPAHDPVHHAPRPEDPAPHLAAVVPVLAEEPLAPPDEEELEAREEHAEGHDAGDRGDQERGGVGPAGSCCGAAAIRILALRQRRGPVGVLAGGEGQPRSREAQPDPHGGRAERSHPPTSVHPPVYPALLYTPARARDRG
mmetsp:Transcript_64731/g.159316  ORF Transcript_64731/g.159316 Transcript_64731/m.159316 type:complete len:306 (+) Transcript_64731:105-1022(+)